MVTVYDVAKAAGLSIASVSRALNNQPGVSQATSQRVAHIAKEMGYEPNDVARSLVGKSTRTIALLVPDIANPFFPELVKSVQAKADENEHVLLLADGAGDRHRVAASMTVLRRKQVDGVIVVATALTVDADELFVDIPTVFLDREGPRLGASVVVNNEAAAFAATTHLIDLGHRRIAHIAGPIDLEVSRQRLAGWRRACSTAGLPSSDDLVVPGNFLEDGGYNVGTHITNPSSACTAVFAANDLSAIGFLAYCADNHLSVPDDISVVGFDGIHLSRYTTPKLTTMAQPIVELGRRAADVLFDLIRGEKSVPRIVLSATLLPGASVASPKAVLQ
ncbi:MAG: hypothetical protein B5766_09665 [Candidatus Lumbricidophila eiseniae]|uniref:HTH lacI-type domain-containing protein n=1 Tax=Candidatus Lumbricidiphila eiseniae TaxID=1969409 RepID=A0A2A6FQ24_9MICO|nr:MAG: hypothetical protein B5766_09665 [Candidatus Lumbricidophila eiseniae]